VPRSTSAQVLRWSDGDTVVTTRGKVRLIGIDTPELGTCGSAAAKRLAERIAPRGTRVRLVDPASVQDADRYGRQLRYVETRRVDVGLRQITARLAVARFDGLDGYDTHPRQAQYRGRAARRGTRCPDWSRPVPPTPSATPTQGTTPTPAPTPTYVAPTTTPDMTTYPPVGKTCPASAPIKGNASSMIYHVHGQRYYSVTVPEACFATASAAEAAGYRAAKV
jgi:endonuclease YncB( thermonuclease family)